jgi:hypothetical protein
VRRLGVSVDLVRHLPDGDCGEETYPPLAIQPIEKDTTGASLASAGELKTLAGSSALR